MGRRRRRAAGVALVVVAVAAAACGGSDSNSVSTTPAVPTGSDSVSIEPETVCVDVERRVAFAYGNSSEAAVAVDASDSVISGATVFDPRIVPTVFAGGRNSPAFWVTATGPEIDVAWSVTGPDAVTRTATASGATPLCTDELLQRTVVDPREPRIEIVEWAPLADGSGVEVTVELVGVPPDSVCGAGLEPRPVSIQMESYSDDIDDWLVVDGTTITFTVDRPTLPEGTRVLAAALVLDECSLGDRVQPSWPGGAFDEVYGASVCVFEIEGDLSVELYDDEVNCGLPFAGGLRSRPG